MRKPLLGLLGVGLVSLVLAPRPAGAWMHAGRWGTASGGGGSWDAEGWHGGSASGGDGSWHARGAWGGTASGGDGSWSGHGADGGYASGGDGSWHATRRLGRHGLRRRRARGAPRVRTAARPPAATARGTPKVPTAARPRAGRL